MSQYKILKNSLIDPPYFTCMMCLHVQISFDKILRHICICCEIAINAIAHGNQSKQIYRIHPLAYINSLFGQRASRPTNQYGE